MTFILSITIFQECVLKLVIVEHLCPEEIGLGWVFFKVRQDRQQLQQNRISDIKRPRPSKDNKSHKIKK